MTICLLFNDEIRDINTVIYGNDNLQEYLFKVSCFKLCLIGTIDHIIVWLIVTLTLIFLNRSAGPKDNQAIIFTTKWFYIFGGILFHYKYNR